MKESLVGLTTIAILFGLVWLSQGNIYTTKTKTERYTNHQNEKNENVEDNYAKSITEEKTQDVYASEEAIDPCDVCGNVYDIDDKLSYDEAYSNMYDNFTFSEAFKLCRQCQGNDGVFYWKDNLYLTKIKQKETTDVEKELTEPKTPPTTTHEAVNSK